MVANTMLSCVFLILVFDKIHSLPNFNQTENLLTGEDIEVSLLCRGNDKLIFKIEEKTKFPNKYLIKINNSNETLVFEKLLIDFPTILQVENLESDSSYTMDIWYENGTIFSEGDDQISTLPDEYNLSQVSYANITEIEVRGDSLSTFLVWNPVPEKVCNYEILVWSLESTEVQQISPELKELYNLELTELIYSSNYSVAVYPVYPEYDEGQKLWINFSTPSCLQENSYNYTICLPDKPNDVKIKYENCKANVTWVNPKIPPKQFILSVFPDNPTLKEFSLKYNGNESSAILDTHDYGDNFNLFLKATAESGSSKSVNLYERNFCNEENQDTHMNSIQKNIYIAAASLVLLVSCIISLTVLLGARKKTMPPTDLKNDDLEKETKVQPEVKTLPFIDEDLEYEIQKERLSVFETIGEGEFGRVCRALLSSEKDKIREVAVKMLRDNATCEDQKQLEKEVKVLKSVGSHTNIVSLIGYCSSDLLLVVEYCSLGDLQNYLRNVWKAKIWMRNVASNMETEGISKNGVCNFLYDKTELERKQFTLTIMDLVSFARQIALGMEYLSRNRVVHRDLAARNVLLTKNLTAKISDFGLSRDIYEENMYRKKSTAKLPIKWMAIESLVHHVFTTHSDVWSFGILLWEIMTLGGCPYPSLLSGQVCDLLLKGYRMERPSACNKKLYDIMLSCWDAIPHRRPSFSNLVDQLDLLIEAESPHKYLQLECAPHYAQLYPTIEEEEKWEIKNYA